MSPDLDATYLRNLSTGDGEGYLNDEKVVRRLAAIAARLEALEKIVKKARAYAFPNGGRGVRHNNVERAVADDGKRHETLRAALAVYDASQKAGA